MRPIFGVFSYVFFLRSFEKKIMSRNFECAKELCKYREHIHLGTPTSPHCGHPSRLKYVRRTALSSSCVWLQWTRFMTPSICELMYYIYSKQEGTHANPFLFVTAGADSTTANPYLFPLYSLIQEGQPVVILVAQAGLPSRQRGWSS